MFPRVSFAIDRGGTFTDVIAQVENEDGSTRLESLKLLSRDPAHYDDAPSEGIRRVLKKCSVPYEREVDGGKKLIDTSRIGTVRMGTTVATNALLERNGAKTALMVSEGFKDVLEIGNQARPKIFDLDIKKPDNLYETVIEARERVRIVTDEEIQSLGEQQVFPNNWHRCENGQVVEIVDDINEEALKAKLTEIHEKGIDSLAISFMHSYIYPIHEQKVKDIALNVVGFGHCSISSELSGMIKYVPRTTTVSVDAAVTPLIKEYISKFRAHFVNNLEDVELLFIQSDGGLTEANSFHGYKAVLSGPAGGVVGCSLCTSHQLGNDVNIVGFDMGGTSTDVCRCEGPKLDHVVEAEIGGTLVQAAQVDVHTVAAGGGSILTWANGMYHVGPASAGAFPGPACYGRGGPLTVTDANLILGRIQPKFFPHVFGKHGDEPLNKEATEQKFAEMLDVIRKDLNNSTLSVEDVASGFLDVANEAMCRPIRNITEARGHRSSEHVLTTFGGAGSQHACAVASKLGISKIYIHRFASFLSAVGIGLSDVVEEAQSHCGWPLNGSTTDATTNMVNKLRQEVTTTLQGKRFPEPIIEVFLYLRFEGTSTALMVEQLPDADIEELFVKKYRQEFGFVLKNRAIVVDDVRVRGLGRSGSTQMTVLGGPPSITLDDTEGSLRGEEAGTSQVFFDGSWIPTPTYTVSANMAPIVGPALLIGNGTTIVVDPSSKAFFTGDGSIVIKNNAAAAQQKGHLSAEYDPLSLSIFAHRFMSIAEQMGHALQRTSISTNIKERLDFSCAIFDPEGNLVVNAPHIPVHLGAMGAAVRFQKDYWGDDWKEGETTVSNHPASGGSHLPDITVMTPCWHDGKVAFYVASRGHHADIGGTTPGSMPPFSKELKEEGALIKAMKLVDVDGVFREEAITEVLMSPGQNEGMSGCRTLHDVLSDLKAQVAANHRGIELVKELVGAYGAGTVNANMVHIQHAAETAVRHVLKDMASKYGTQLSAEDKMDDGTKIAVDVEIDAATGDASFDFSRSGDQVDGSTNCPTAVVKSALIYSLRCMVGQSIPLNQGCLAPITVKTRPGSILAPEENRAVVAGNVLTSQRITDVVLSATKAAACSQGCMNNFTMGNDTFAYYETICGGAGAGPTFNGASAVQTHMTNTRITDPEILESRYPVMLKRFEIRRGSGGDGAQRGGDGVIREILFLRPLSACILSERRELRPKGICGGSDGAAGINRLKKSAVTAAAHGTLAASVSLAVESAYKTENITGDAAEGDDIGGKNKIDVKIGDAIVVMSPGGGGYGKSE